MRKSKYTAELLAPIVASSSSFTDVMRKLGLTPTGGNHRMITARIRLAGLDTSHFHGGRAKSIRAILRDELVRLSAQSSSVAQVLARLGLPLEGGCHRAMAARLRELEIDTGHFQGRGWSRGHTRATHPSVDRVARKGSFPDEAVFVENGPALNGPAIVKRLLAKGWVHCCATCGISSWRDQPLVLHLDHINGTHNDHRLENLRLLCPNCHSQTDTYCNRAREQAACYTCVTRAWRNW